MRAGAQCRCNPDATYKTLPVACARRYKYKMSVCVCVCSISMVAAPLEADAEAEENLAKRIDHYGSC